MRRTSPKGWTLLIAGLVLALLGLPLQAEDRPDAPAQPPAPRTRTLKRAPESPAPPQGDEDDDEEPAEEDDEQSPEGEGEEYEGQGEEVEHDHGEGARDEGSEAPDENHGDPDQNDINQNDADHQEGERQDTRREEKPRSDASARRQSRDKERRSRDREREKARRRAQRSEAAIDTLDPKFAGKVRRVVKRLEAAGWQPVVVSGKRTVAQQRKILAAGRSRTMNSLHLCGRAADLMDHRYGWQGEAKRPDFAFWVALGKAARAEGLVWGGDWKRFKDVPHIQIGSKCPG